MSLLRFRLIIGLLCLLTGCASVVKEVARGKKPLLRVPVAPRATWKGEALFSYADTSGNKNTTNASVFLRAVRETPLDTVTLKFAYDYGTVDRELSKRNSLGFFKYDRKLSDKFYGYAHTALAMNYFTGLEMRSDTGAGAGWHTYSTQDDSLRCELGFNYTNEDYREDFPPRLKSNVNYSGCRIAMVAEKKLSKYVTFYHLDEFIAPFDNINYWRYHSHLILAVQLNEKLSLKAGLIFYHDRRAPKGTRRSDSSILAGLGYKF